MRLSEMVKYVILQAKDSTEWKQGLPTNPGAYWFWSIRYGQMKCSKEKEPELVIMEVRSDANGNPIRIADGQFVWSNEPTDCWYRKLEIPKLPFEIEKEKKK